MAIFNAFAEGAGNAAERIVTVSGGTIAIAGNRIVRLTSIVSTYRGVGIIRLRSATLLGAKFLEIRFAADGTIDPDLRSPLQIVSPAAGLNLVVTEEGLFINTIFLSGKIS